MKRNNKCFAISMTVLWCIVLTNVMSSRWLGLCMGVCIGGVFGLFDSGREEPREDSESEVDQK